jgi:predicted DNA-binding transcriptional regulator YafY
MAVHRRPTIAASAQSAEASLRWSVEQRLVFIEERLFWHGEVNRGDLVCHFGVSPSQASKDIARYLGHAPDGLTYDRSAKRYVAGDGFRPVLAVPDAAGFLGALRLVDLGMRPREERPRGTVVPFDAAPIPERMVDPYVLRAILFAIRDRTGLTVAYQSMSREEPVRRKICPHALAHDGFRWHARAFDMESGEFRDFVLGRIGQPKADRRVSTPPRDDHDWQTFVELVIAPHPGLTPPQRRAIALDYGILRGSIRMRVRRALLFYALKKLGLDLPDNARPPHQQHIVLLNRAEILERPIRQQQA